MRSPPLPAIGDSKPNTQSTQGEPGEPGELVTHSESITSSWSTPEGRRVRRRRLSNTASSSWKLSRKELVIKKELGRTLKSTVYLATWKGTEVAVKCAGLHQGDLAHEEVQSPNDEIADELLQEIEHLSSFRHPDLVMFLGASLESSLPMCVTEYMPMGDMERYYALKCEKHQNPFWHANLKQVFEWASAICRALSFLHGRDIPMVHRDLKPLNLLLTKHLEVKVSDLGIARVLAMTAASGGSGGGRNGMTGGIGSWRYMAPEVVRHQKYNEKVDIYALGLIAYFMSSGKQPFHQLGRDPEQILKEYLKGNEPRPLLLDCPRVLRHSMARAWHQNAEERPAADEMLAEILDLKLPGCAPCPTM